jgi:hypothetical protein
MDTISNPLAIPLSDLLQRLNVLNGYVLLLDNQLKNFQNLFENSYKNNNVDISNIFAGFTLDIRDLTISTDQKYHSYLAAGIFVKEGEEYLKAADEIISYWSAWTVAQCYESFETFLRDINAYYYFGDVPHQPIGKLEHIPVETGNLDAWKALFRNRSWNTFTLLEQLRATAPLLADYEKTNVCRINLADWHDILAPVRHAITHANFLLHRRSREKGSKNLLDDLLPKYFSGTWITPDIYNLNITKEQAGDTVQLTGDYAHLIFKCLCDANGSDWQVLHRLS